ncbi:MAG: hypothetical protein AAF206_16905 [Bacteroidota bacterium]
MSNTLKKGKALVIVAIIMMTLPALFAAWFGVNGGDPFAIVATVFLLLGFSVLIITMFIGNAPARYSLIFYCVLIIGFLSLLMDKLDFRIGIVLLIGWFFFPIAIMTLLPTPKVFFYYQQTGEDKGVNWNKKLNQIGKK